VEDALAAGAAIKYHFFGHILHREQDALGAPVADAGD
jgi:hypothetical protein